MPPTRQQVYRRRRAVVFGGVALLLVAVFYLPFTLLAPITPVAAEVQTPQTVAEAAAQPVLPSYGGAAVGAVGWDGVLASSGSTAQLPMASITKTITALVVLEAKPLDVGEDGPTLDMTSRDVGYMNRYLRENGSIVPVKAGERFTEREMLEVALIRSANNYATSLAVWAYGSEDAYVAAARAWLTAHHLDGITVVDTCGIDPRNTATTGNLLDLGRLVLQNPVLEKIVGTATTTMHDLGELHNTNGLIGHGGVDGIKTGTLDSFGSNLMFSTDWKFGSDTVTVIGVVLGAHDHTQVNADVKALLTSVRAGFHRVTVAKKGTAYAGYETRWGQRTTAVAQRDASLLVWSDQKITAAVKAAPIRADARGTGVGTVTFDAGRSRVSVPLTLSKAITDPGPGWRLANPLVLAGVG